MLYPSRLYQTTRIRSTMSDHRSRFLQLALNADALRFGQFTLKSGRVSPYFFNAGRFDTGLALAQLGNCYADAVESSGVAVDQLFGFMATAWALGLMELLLVFAVALVPHPRTLVGTMEEAWRRIQAERCCT